MRAKIVIAGGFAVGKTTMIKTLSEMMAVETDAAMTAVADSESDLSAKRTTTTAMDVGRIKVDDKLVLYLYGTPGQTRFWFLWDELVRGAIGVVVLVDVRRVADSFAPIDFCESRRLPFSIALSTSDGAPRYETAEVRDALALPADVPIVTCDVRDHASSRQALLSLVEYVIARKRASAVEGVASQRA